jgi:hypothetical protein
MIQPNVLLVVLLDPGLNGMPNLSNVDLTTFAADSVNARCFEIEIIFDRQKETVALLRWEAYSFCVMSH